jgi:very-short-patch-repair endonuclease
LDKKMIFRQSAFNRITGKHVDFVLCDLADLSVVGVIELDDRSHDRFERGVRDGLVDSALAGAGIPVLRIPARQSYSPAQIREQVETAFRTRERVAKNVG